MTTVLDTCRRAAAVKHEIGTLGTNKKNAALLAIADALEANREQIKAANRLDIEAGRSNGLNEGLIDRLTLDDSRIDGVAEGCRQAGCALVGGETAEMPGMYTDGEYDIAGFTVGCVEKSNLIDGSKVKAGDVLVGIASSGVHSNGFSLVRKVVADAGFDFKDLCPEFFGDRMIGEVLLTPTRIYVKQVLEVIRNCEVHGVAHITGGGFDENIPRILHEGQGIEIEEGSWEILPVFGFLEKYGRIPHREMFNIFNMGIGMVIALDASEAGKAIEILRAAGEKASVIGRVSDREGVVIK